jgi:hypothetical protein
MKSLRWMDLISEEELSPLDILKDSSEPSLVSLLPLPLPFSDSPLLWQCIQAAQSLPAWEMIAAYEFGIPPPAAYSRSPPSTAMPGPPPSPSSASSSLS